MSLIRKLRDRLQGATLHDLWVETRWVLHHSKRYRRSIAAYVLLGFASIALSLLSSLGSRELINAIVYLQGGGRRVLFCGVTVVLLAGSTIVLNALVSRFSAKINLRVGNELRAEVFGMFLNTDWESLQQFHSGDLLSRINTDVSNVAGSVLGWIPSLILRLTQFLASLAVILVYDPTMAVLALLSAPVTLLLSRPLVGKMRSFNRDMRAVGSEMTAFQEETLQNIPAIKAFHLVDAFRERLDRVQERYYDTGIAFQRFSILTSSFLSSCGMLVSYLCLGWGAYRLWQGRIDFGTVAETLRLVRPDAPEEALWAALRAACAEDFVRGLPGGLDCPLRERGGSLSEGQNQRLAIARAILADAPILLLDEVTSALDLETEQRVLENIAALPGKTCILSTHRPSVLSLCSRVYRLHNAALELLPESEWRRLYRNN